MTTTENVRVWDPIVRISHWLVVACVAANLMLLDSGGQWHRWAGYLAVGVVAVRTVWGFIGSQHARFADWFPLPSRLFPYLGQLLRGKEPRMLGHNPAGAVMMLILWLLILALGMTGYMLGLDEYFGDDALEGFHGMLSNVLIGAVVVHIAAAIFESVRHRENLMRSMVTGTKRVLEVHRDSDNQA